MTSLKDGVWLLLMLGHEVLYISTSMIKRCFLTFFVQKKLRKEQKAQNLTQNLAKQHCLSLHQIASQGFYSQKKMADAPPLISRTYKYQSYNAIARPMMTISVRNCFFFWK